MGGCNYGQLPVEEFFTGQKNGPIVINKFCCAVSPRQPAKHVKTLTLEESCIEVFNGVAGKK